MTTGSKYAKMSELMENAKDHLPEWLFIDMYNQLKICKEDYDEAIADAILKEKERENEVLSQIKESLNSHFEILN